MSGGALPIDQREATAILQWLIDNPHELALLRSVIQLERLPEAVHPDDIGPPGVVTRLRQHVSDWMATTRLGWCGHCLQPVLVWADGLLSNWPERTVHRCREPHEARPVSSDRSVGARPFVIGSGLME